MENDLLDIVLIIKKDDKSLEELEDKLDIPYKDMYYNSKKEEEYESFKWLFQKAQEILSDKVDKSLLNDALML